MRRALSLLILSLSAACSSSSKSTSPCDAARQTGCDAGLYCEPQGSATACFAPVLVRGTVVDPTVDASISGARVVALDASRAPVSTVATTAVDGGYEIAVRAARDASGKPVSTRITLRADAHGYQTFPGGLRTALPVDLSTAADRGGRWVVSGPLTALELLPLPGAGTGRIAGTVSLVAGVAAPLVVADPQGATTVATATAVAGSDGAYALFNLAPGVPYVVRPYASGANWSPSAPTAPGAPAVVDFAAPTATAATVSGGLIFRTGASTSVDVELVIESTYNTTLDRGEAPPGLALHAAGNGYVFAGVPDGRYRVLAAYGVDGDVRDQSNTGNATPPTVTVAGGASAVASASFAVVPAVHLVSIGGTPVGLEPVTVVTTTPTPAFAWTNEGATNADLFRVYVFDGSGNTVWQPADVAGASAMTVTYAGPALTPELPYQLRVVAIKTTGGVDLQSQTEDLLGVFMLR